VATVG